MKKMLLMVALLGLAVSARAVDPDPTSLYTGLQTPFNAALTFALGAMGTLLVVGWILRGLRGRK